MEPKPAYKPVAPAVPARRPEPKSGEVAAAASQPFRYPLEFPYEEPDWTRIPGYRNASRSDWESAVWQRKHTVKNLKELKATPSLKGLSILKIGRLSVGAVSAAEWKTIVAMSRKTPS